MAQVASSLPQGDGQHQNVGKLGPLLCWAVVFADIGSSIYYVPGILYGSVGNLAGFFVLLTMAVFVLLTLKYAEVSARFPEGGGVVSVAAQALNPWMGALGGMLILVSYFLTAAISCLSAIHYLSVVLPAIGPYIVWITIGVLALLGLLNWLGISESAKVSLIAALIAFGSDLAIIFTVFTHIPISELPFLFDKMFAHATLTPSSLLVGFAGAFLAFSGLESISQLSPVMKAPRKKIIGLALALVVITIGVTSPLLTMLSTLLQQDKATDPVLATQLLSLLGGHWGNILLQTEVALSASLILIFASNTAVIGAYHVFIALSRMEFFPEFILKRNRLRSTPHWSIALAVGIPIAVLVLVNGNINLLGDLYAFGLLGAFTLTCLGLDIVRYRERRRANATSSSRTGNAPDNGFFPADPALSGSPLTQQQSHPFSQVHLPGLSWWGGMLTKVASSLKRSALDLWHRFEFEVGLVTTLLVLSAWSISLVSKPLATVFGGSVVLTGLSVAAVGYLRGRIPVVVPYLEGHVPGSLLAVLPAGSPHNEQIIDVAVSAARGKPLVFLYLAEPQGQRTPRLFEVVDPYLDDQQAKDTLKQAALLARKAGLARRFVYRQKAPETVARVWRQVQPHDVLLAQEDLSQVEEVNPDRIRYELTPSGKIAHLLKQW